MTNTILTHYQEEKMHNKLFIFDLDGVLVEACDWHRDALNEALLETCNFKISQEDHVSTFNGIPTSKKLKILTERGLVPTEIHKRINDLKQEKTVEIINKKASQRQEKIHLIQEIKRRGHTVCCYTNSIRKTAELMLEKTGIKKLFDTVLTNQDVVNPKPNPEGYLYLMSLHNYSKSETIIVEDSPKGIQAAKESGAQVIVVKNSYDVDLDLLRRYI
jgi:HAD superfamily hydrolase (TIGR01509 family)